MNFLRIRFFLDRNKRGRGYLICMQLSREASMVVCSRFAPESTEERRSGLESQQIRDSKERTRNARKMKLENSSIQQNWTNVFPGKKTSDIEGLERKCKNKLVISCKLGMIRDNLRKLSQSFSRRSKNNAVYLFPSPWLDASRSHHHLCWRSNIRRSLKRLPVFLKLTPETRDKDALEFTAWMTLSLSL
jgi:hypothetical protein